MGGAQRPAGRGLKAGHRAILLLAAYARDSGENDHAKTRAHRPAGHSPSAIVGAGRGASEPTPTPCPDPSDVVGWATERILEEVERVTNREIEFIFNPDLLETLFDSDTGVYTYRGEFHSELRAGGIDQDLHGQLQLQHLCSVDGNSGPGAVESVGGSRTLRRRPHISQGRLGTLCCGKSTAILRSYAIRPGARASGTPCHQLG